MSGSGSSTSYSGNSNSMNWKADAMEMDVKPWLEALEALDR